MASFWLAYKVQSRDAYYKELTIKPVLVTHVDNDFTYTLRNNGLGPAVITDWTLTFEGVSYKIETMNAEKLHTMGQHMSKHPLKDVFAGIKVPAPGGTIFLESTMQEVGTIVDRGEALTMFRIPAEQRKHLEDVMQKTTPMHGAELSAKFVKAVATLPFVFNYCSLSGLTCTNHKLLDCP
jgi:hypothetical protein